MLDDFTMFNRNEAKSETITIRLTYRQKQRINRMAKFKGVTVSRFLLDLIRSANDRLIGEGLLDKDDLPF